MTRHRPVIRLGATALLCAATVVGCSSAEPGRVANGSAASASSAPTSEAPASVGPGSVASVAPASRAPASVAPVAAAPVARNGCAHNTAAHAVRVNLGKQHLWMCSGTRLVRDTPITSGVVGRYTSTPTGHYVVQGVQRDTTLTLISGETFAVKYWIPFDGPLFGFHDSSWQDFPYGSSLYRTRGSHGCVHVPLKAIAFLARWAGVGTEVTIHA